MDESGGSSGSGACSEATVKKLHTNFRPFLPSPRINLANRIGAGDALVRTFERADEKTPTKEQAAIPTSQAMATYQALIQAQKKGPTSNKPSDVTTSSTSSRPQSARGQVIEYYIMKI